MKTTTHWRIPLVGWVVIAIAVAAEAASNALRAFGLGANLEKFTVVFRDTSISLSGAVLALAAVAISIAQARAVWVAFTAGPMRQRILASLTGALLIAVSAVALSQHVLKGMRYETSGEVSSRERHDRAAASYDKAKAELDSLGNPRPVAVIQAAVQSTKIDMAVWRRSRECSDISREDTKDACRPILALYQERGAAARKAEIEPEVARLKAELDANPKPLKAGDAEDQASSIWAWLFSIAVVTIATFGSVLFARVETVETSAKPLETRAGQISLPAPHEETDDLPPSGGQKNKQEALADLLTLSAMGHSAPSQDWLAERWGRPKGTVSKWLGEWEDRDLITRSQDGRCKAVSA